MNLDISRRSLLSGTAALAVAPTVLEVLDERGAVLLEQGSSRSARDRLTTALRLYLRAVEAARVAGRAFVEVAPALPVQAVAAAAPHPLPIRSWNGDGDVMGFTWYPGRRVLHFGRFPIPSEAVDDVTLFPRWRAAMEGIQEANVRVSRAADAVTTAVLAVFGSPAAEPDARENPKQVVVLDGDVFIFQGSYSGWTLAGQCDAAEIVVLR